MKKQPNPELLDQDAPELSRQWFDQARPASEVLPEIFPAKLAADMLAPKRSGRPRKEQPKEAVKLRIDPDVMAVLRATGPGWQTRVNTILRERFAL